MHVIHIDVSSIEMMYTAPHDCCSWGNGQYYNYNITKISKAKPLEIQIYLPPNSEGQLSFYIVTKQGNNDTWSATDHMLRDFKYQLFIYRHIFSLVKMKITKCLKKYMTPSNFIWEEGKFDVEWCI